MIEHDKDVNNKSNKNIIEFDLVEELNYFEACTQSVHYLKNVVKTATQNEYSQKSISYYEDKLEAKIDEMGSRYRAAFSAFEDALKTREKNLLAKEKEFLSLVKKHTPDFNESFLDSFECDITRNEKYVNYINSVHDGEIENERELELFHKMVQENLPYTMIKQGLQLMTQLYRSTYDYTSEFSVRVDLPNVKIMPHWVLSQIYDIAKNKADLQNKVLDEFEALKLENPNLSNEELEELATSKIKNYAKLQNLDYIRLEKDIKQLYDRCFLKTYKTETSKKSLLQKFTDKIKSSFESVESKHMKLFVDKSQSRNFAVNDFELNNIYASNEFCFDYDFFMYRAIIGNVLKTPLYYDSASFSHDCLALAQSDNLVKSLTDQLNGLEDDEVKSESEECIKESIEGLSSIQFHDLKLNQTFNLKNGVMVDKKDGKTMSVLNYFVNQFKNNACDVPNKDALDNLKNANGMQIYDALCRYANESYNAKNNKSQSEQELKK